MVLDAFANVKTRSPLKVSLIFALGIILPSGFLTFIGLRSYQYEERLMQKETEERFSAVADLVQKKVANRLAELTEALDALARQPPFQRLDVPQIVPILMATPHLDHVAPENLFVFDEADRLAAPWREETPGSIRSSSPRDLDWGRFSDEIERLERLEFVSKDYSGALHGYIALEEEPLTQAQHAALLKNIAGDYRKLNQNRQAATTYLKLATQYEQLADISGYPMGLLGRQMAIELYEGDKAWKNALDTRLDLYEGLLLRRWTTLAPQRAALMTDLRAPIERSLTMHVSEAHDRKQRWERIQAHQSHLEAFEQAGERFAKNDWPDVLRRLHRLGRLDQGAVLQMNPVSLSKITVVAPILSSQSGHRRGTLVAVLPAQAVWPLINEAMQDVAGPAGVKVEWEHSEINSNAARHVWKTSLRRDVNAIDPPLHFTLIDMSSSTRDQLFRRRQWIFGGVIGISFIVIVVGLLIMAQAVKRETELANLKADFVANVSHELRTPLAAISHIGERLSLGRYRSEEERKEFYGLLGQETHRLRGLIEDILDFSKMLAGKKVYRSERLDLVSLARESLEGFQSKAASKGFEVITDLASAAIWILGDPRAIRQAILNLLDNAMKYSGDARRIQLRVVAAAGTGIVAVKDQGIGIPASEKDKIFEKFYRVEHATPSPAESGVGLGLAMVKHVIEGHGGKIEVESQLGRGSTFTLVFPLAQGGIHGSHSHS